MTTQYTPILALALPVTGELSGTWGDVVNDNITSMVEQAIAGLATINTWSGNGHTLTTADGLSAESRCAMLVLTDTGTALTGAATVICPTASKIYIVKNTSGQSATITTAAGTGVAIPNGETMFVFCDGTNVVQAVTRIASADVDFAKLKGTGAVVVTNILDEDDMVSDSATALATQQSIKAYVDSQISANNDLSEILANGNTTGGTDIAVSAGDDITFTDTSKAIFGAGSDLQIYHDGTNSYIDDQGTGNLYIRGSSYIQLQDADGNVFINCVDDGTGGRVQLRNEGSTKLATTSTGIDVTGTAEMDGLYVLSTSSGPVFERAAGTGQWSTVEIKTNDTVTGDSRIYFSDTDAQSGEINYNHAEDRFEFSTAGVANVYISNNGWIGINKGTPEVAFEINGSAGNGPSFTGEISGTTLLITSVASGSVSVGDLVTGAEVQPNTVITALGTGTGGLGTYTVSVAQTAASSQMWTSIESNYKNVLLRISSTDTSVNAGQIDGAIQFYGADASTPGAGLGAYIAAVSEDSAPDTSLVFGTRSGATTGVDANRRLTIGSRGDISFYDEAGNTPKLTWDASAESLNFADNAKAIFGAGSDLQIYHDGTNSYITDAGTGRLNLRSDGTGIDLQTSQGETMLRALKDSYVRLYYDNAEKLDTTSTGIDVTGTVVADGLTVDGASEFINQDTTAVASIAPLTPVTNSEFQFYNSDNAAAYTAIRFRTRSAAASSWVVANEWTASYKGDLAFYSRDGSASITQKMRLLNNGDISFYEDTGTTPKFFWDASAESLGIGTDSPGVRLEVHDTANDMQLRLGAATGSAGINPTIRFQARNTADALSKYASIKLNPDDNVLTLMAPAGSTPSIDALNINSSGNVGINTNSPQEALHIEQGNVYIKGTSPILMFTDTNSFTDANDRYYIRAATDNLQFQWYDDSTATVTTRVVFDSTGNVGIGGDPSTMLQLSTTNSGLAGSAPNNILRFNDTDTTVYGEQPTGRIEFYINDATAGGTGIASYIEGRAAGTNGGGHIIFASSVGGATGATERMRLGSQGSLLVGTVTQNTVGVTLDPDGYIYANRVSDPAGFFDRDTTDGDIVSFRKDGTTVGSIGSEGGDSLYIVNGDTGFRFSGNSDVIVPSGVAGAVRDAAISLGTGTQRFKDLYLSGGVYVGGTAAANHLDDYEVGNIEVTVTATTGTPTIAATENNIRYVKIGNAVVISGQLGTISCSGCGGTLSVDLGIVTPSLLTDRSEYQSILARCSSTSYPIVELYNLGGTSVWLVRAWSGSGSFDANAASAFASLGNFDINLGGGCSFVTA